MSRIVEENKKISEADITSEKQDNKISIPEESRRAFIRVIKIGYYKEFHKQGLITDEQLQRLIEMQNDYTHTVARS